MSDLSTLASEASKAVSRTAPTPVPRRRRRFKGAGPLLLGAALVAVAIFGTNHFWPYHAAPTQAKVAQDLTFLVERARMSVEEALKDTGKLPQSLSNASLAAVVAYEVRDSQYRLKASMGGVWVAIEWDGSTTTGKDQTK